MFCFVEMYWLKLTILWPFWNFISLSRISWGAVAIVSNPKLALFQLLTMETEGASLYLYFIEDKGKISERENLFFVTLFILCYEIKNEIRIGINLEII